MSKATESTSTPYRILKTKMPVVVPTIENILRNDSIVLAIEFDDGSIITINEDDNMDVRCYADMNHYLFMDSTMNCLRNLKFEDGWLDQDMDRVIKNRVSGIRRTRLFNL